MVRAYDHAGNYRDGVADIRGLNFVLSLLKENYIGLLIVFAVIIFGSLRHRFSRNKKIYTLPPKIDEPQAQTIP